MPIAMLTIELRIPLAQSLKDRRQAMRSVKESLRHSFNISIAEMDEVPVYQRGTLGIVAISHSRDYLAGLMAEVESAAQRHAANAGAEVADAWWEFVEDVADGSTA